jgi:peptide maturation system acyl carrier-related protein
MAKRFAYRGEEDIMNITGTKSLPERLNGIFQSRLNIDFEDPMKGDRDKHLLGRPHSLEARDLLYLLFDIEREFGIRIPEDEIANGRFSSYNSILEIITAQCREPADGN